MPALVPYISSWAYIPNELLGVMPIVWKSRLTISPRAFKGQPARKLHMYDDTVPGYLGLPIEYGLQKFPRLEFEDRTVLGGECYYNRLPSPDHPRAGPGQARFMEELYAACVDQFTVLGKAATGAGKTVVGLRTAALLGRRTLIVVPTEDLARQWAEETTTHLGIAPDNIGWVQANFCNWQAPFCVGVINSICGRPYEPNFYEAFGTIIYDEGHRYAAPYFRQAIGMFPARTKIMLTATDRRKDGAENAFFWYFGHAKVRSTQEARPITVHVLEHRTKVSRYVETTGGICTALVQDEARNELICRVVRKLYVRGRQALYLGDRIEHMQGLIQDCAALGIPITEMGLYVGRRYTGTTRYSFPALKIYKPGSHCVYWKPIDGSEPRFTHKEVVRIVRRISPSEIEVQSLQDASIKVIVYTTELRSAPIMVPVTVEVPKEELARIKEHSRIIFATYGMLKEGKDIPRLDAGMDLTPRADGEQAIGRVRRIFPGAPNAVWYTLHDLSDNGLLEGLFRARVKDYGVAGARIEYHDATR